MTDITKCKYVKRTQKDYSMSFKLRVVEEIEQGDLGIKATASNVTYPVNVIVKKTITCLESIFT